MKKFLLISIIFLSCLIFSRATVFAADVSISLPAHANVGSTFEVLINASTDEELINSVDITIDYPEELLTFVGYKNDGGVMRLWIDSPHEKDGKVYFSGIIPGGVMGLYDTNKKGLSPIPLARLLFVGKSAGNAELSFTKAEILKNDGMGTPLLLDQRGAQMTINDAGNDSSENEENIEDKNPPEPFFITFIESSLSTGTPGMIVFQADDSLSGIKEYKMKIGASEWQNTKSPQAVSRGIFPHKITIRAFDFYGNFRDAEISIPGLVSPVIFAIFFALLLFGILGYKLLKYRP